MMVQPMAEPQAGTQQIKKQIDLLLAQAGRHSKDVDRLFLLASEARELSRVAQYTHGQAQSELLLASYHERKGSYSDALEECFNALSFARANGDIAMQAQTLHALALLYRRIGDAAEALACSNQALELLTANDALLRLGLNGLFLSLLILRGELLMLLHRHGEALAVLLEALPTAQEEGGETLERLHLSISESYLLTGNLSAAMQNNRKAMEVAIIYELSPDEYAVIEMMRGAIHERGSDAASALIAYKDALPYAIRTNSKYAVSSTLACIGRMQLSLRQVDAAKSTLNKALAIAWEIDSDELAREIHERLAVWYDERDYLESTASSGVVSPREDDSLRVRLSHLKSLQAKPEQMDNKEIFRQINEEIKDHVEEIRSLRLEVEEQAHAMASLADIGRTVAGSEDILQCVRLLGDELGKIITFDILAVGVCKDAQKLLEYPAVCTQESCQPSERRALPAEILKAIRSARDVILSDIRPEDAQRYSVIPAAAEALPRSALFCPFLCAGEPHVLILQSRQADAFDSADLRLMRTAAQMLGLAMAAQVRMAALTRQEASMRQLVRVDALTGLLSRHDIIERIEEENIRAQRNKRPFTLVLMEADQLRSLRDSAGQECFDALLRQLSRLLRPAIRKQDFLARWSDDQFAILLPETDGDGAYKLCEKLRQKCTRQTFTWQGQEHALTLTCGLAERRNSRTMDAMQKAAESALLAAKLKGRDCIEKR